MRSHPPLDNPLWNALTTRQADHGFGGVLCKRFDPVIGPFAAVAESTAEAEMELADLVKPGEQVGLLAVSPPFSDAWAVERDGHILQMVCEDARGEHYPEARLMTPDHVPDMLELTGLVYPAYFRKGTPRLGAYFGVFDGDKLCAMAGERVGMTGYQEISAVCTHPDYTGRGYASRLVNHLVKFITERGDVPFLHVDHDNERAIALYERLGFELRWEIPFWVVSRQ